MVAAENALAGSLELPPPPPVVPAVAAALALALAAAGGSSASTGAAPPQTQTTTATSDGPFSLNFSNIADGGTVLVTAFQSDNPNCSDTRKYIISKTTGSASVITWELTASLLDFQLILLANFQTQSSDEHVIFSDLCAFAVAQSDGHIPATFQILNHSDVFASDATILSGQQNVFVNCSGQCLNIAEQSNAFLFQICSFTSDPVIKYSDGNPAHAISNHHITSMSAVSQTSDIAAVSLTEIFILQGPSSIPAGPSTLEMLFRALFVLLGFILFGMLFAPVF